MATSNKVQGPTATALRLVAIGNSTGIILPKELIDKMRVSKGDTLFVRETPTGFVMTPWDDEFARQMEIAERVMREDRDVLKRLAE
jgi:putative addiction module antidote